MRTRWATEFGWGTEFGWNEANAPGPQTEDSRERGFLSDANDDAMGVSDALIRMASATSPTKDQDVGAEAELSGPRAISQQGFFGAPHPPRAVRR